MQQVTIGTKNQIVIPKEVRKKIAGLKPGRKVSVYSSDKNTVVIKVSEKSWVDRNYGIIREAPQGMSMAEQIEEMRNEWDER